MRTSHTTSYLRFVLSLTLAIVSVLLCSATLHAQEKAQAKDQLLRLIPQATAIDRKLFEGMRRSAASPKASDYNDHSLTAELLFVNVKQIQASKGEFRFLTKGHHDPQELFEEMYRSVGTGRLQTVTRPVTMIHRERIEKLDFQIDGNKAIGSFEFQVPELYEGKTNFTAKRVGEKWRLTRFQMPNLKIDIRSDEAGQWWRTEDLANHQPPLCLIGHTDTVWSLDFSQNGKRLVSGSKDRSIRIWNAVNGEAELKIPQAHGTDPAVPAFGGVLSVCFRPDDRQIASGSDDGTVKIWNAETGMHEFTIEVKGIVDGVLFAPDGRSVLSSSSALEIWNANNGQLEQTIRGHSYPSVDMSPNGRKIVTGGAEPHRKNPNDDRKTIKLWDAKSGERLATSATHHNILITDIKFCHDGKRIASCATGQDHQNLECRRPPTVAND